MIRESQRVANLLGRREAQRVAAVTSPQDFNKRITLQYQTKIPDGMGGLTASWSDAATVWAAIWPTSAREQIESLQPGLNISHRIRIRYRAGVKASWRIKYALRYFNIVSLIDPGEKHELLDILAKEAAS